jgi:M6 family metalloprotease-like protein
MKKSLILILALFWGCLAVNAIPAYPGKLTVTLPNGKQVILTHRGDEHFSFFTDEEGNAYRRSANQGGFEQISMDKVREIWQSRLTRANKARSIRAAKRIGKPAGNLIGTKKGLVILMQYADYSFVTKNVKAVFQDYFNKTGYTDYGMAGSVRDYFKAQSYGLFDLEFDVVGPYTAAHSMVYYGAHNGNEHDIRPEELIKEACEMADADVNFADYDWDNDGEVNQVFVVYAGYGENYDNTADNIFANCLWPHEWNLKYAGINLRLDGKDITTYACSCELDGIEGTNLDGIGAACHEFSHCLGLPDFYDSRGDNYGMGSWDVMDQGNYNNNSRTPAGYTSYERMFAGWFSPTELNTMTRIEGMKPLTESPEAYILYNENNRNEYYLLENRQFDGFDKAIPGHGLLVLHVDYDETVWKDNLVNTNTGHPRMTYIPADNKLNYNTQSNDPFPSSKGVTSLTNYTTPAATLFNENTDGRKLMSKPIDHITESEDGLISFVACRPELAIPEPGEGQEIEGEAAFTISWPAVNGAIGYEVEVTEVGTSSDDPKEALIREFNFDEFVSKSIGFTDVSSKMTDYGLKGWSGNKIYTSPNKIRIGTSSATGYVSTATWYVPQSSEFTIVMGADVGKAGTSVKGKLRMAYGNDGDKATYETVDFEVTGDGRQVFSFQVKKDLFWIEIRPEGLMHLNYLAIYDGIWSLEQLGYQTNAARQSARRKASIVTNHTTDTNSITLRDLNTKSRFMYKVRTLGEEDTYSLWSEEHTFKFSNSSGIEGITANPGKNAPIYDLQGRSYADPTDLRRGFYIIGGKKVIK